MRWFIRREIPAIDRLLLVESGQRADAELLVPRLRHMVSTTATIDLFTCLPDQPVGLGEGTRTWRSYEAKNNRQRWKLLLGIRRQRHAAAAILCGKSPLLAIWKVALAVALPAKILLVDEVEGLVWLDRGHWRKVMRVGVSAAGLQNPATWRRLGRLAFAPIGLPVLLAFALKVHLRRLIRATRFTGTP